MASGGISARAEISSWWRWVSREHNVSGGEASPMKKTYEKPIIIHTETIEARAIRCAKLDDNGCPGGPVTS